MRRLGISLILVLIAAGAFGHAGELHTYMGSVTAVHDDGTFMLKTTAGKTIHVGISNATKFIYSDGRAAKRALIVKRKRVVVTISKDGKTASIVKLASPAAKKK